ncbi:MAG TPA: addiction module antitoxin RelB [Candidatus Cloacimonetes bacterium]|nr:MAG: addiction module antitoxin RelB [Beggiatoa sp. 4572_84]HHE39985.1 addiction module antitoxin RelB [Candidatus Cloacimonadota bacterium]
MKSEVKSITENALRLSAPARACIVEILLESLDFEEDFPISEQWRNEIIKRCDEIDNGNVELISGEVAMTRLREKYL